MLPVNIVIPVCRTGFVAVQMHPQPAKAMKYLIVGRAATAPSGRGSLAYPSASHARDTRIRREESLARCVQSAQGVVQEPKE